MYKHILVPIDDSDLAVDLVAKAVAFACFSGARISFLHVRRDYGATDGGALVRVLSPDEFASHVEGNALGLLKRAQAEADRAKVACEVVVRTSDRPYEMIVEEASERGCDLIFMASHGRRGLKSLVVGSQTQKVLAHAVVPVLISTVESNLPQSAADAAIKTIRGEHRSIAAVVNGLRFVLREAVDKEQAPNIPLLRAMLFYFKTFPDALHHPREEEFLFKLLRSRAPEYDDLLAATEEQHHEQSLMIEKIEASLDLYESTREPSALREMCSLADRFSDHLWAHMNMEEKNILPACLEYFGDVDWRRIKEVFEGHADPRFDSDRESGFENLFTRIMNVASRSSAERSASETRFE